MASPLRNGPLADINLTPLIDVLLVLIVLLMLMVPLFVKRLPVELPEVATTGAPKVTHTVAIAVQADSDMYLVGNELLLEPEVAQRISEGDSVELQVAASVSFERVARLLGLLEERKPGEVYFLVR